MKTRSTQKYTATIVLLTYMWKEKPVVYYAAINYELALSLEQHPLALLPFLD